MKHDNKKKQSRLERFPDDSIETSYKTIQGLLSFNFKYIDESQGQKFSELTDEQKSKLFEKLRWYSRETRQHWENERIGNASNRVLAVYGDFPKKSEFYHPKWIPADVRWARFRLEGDMRLIGFVIDRSDAQKFNLHDDVFYAVFIDPDHKFYITDK